MSRSWRDRKDYRRYRNIRAVILAINVEENDGKCTLAIPNVCTGLADQVHHTKGKEYGDDPKYMVAACKACNLHVGQPGRRSPEPKQVTQW